MPRFEVDGLPPGWTIRWWRQHSQPWCFELINAAGEWTIQGDTGGEAGRAMWPNGDAIRMAAWRRYTKDARAGRNV